MHQTIALTPRVALSKVFAFLSITLLLGFASSACVGNLEGGESDPTSQTSNDPPTGSDPSSGKASSGPTAGSTSSDDAGVSGGASTTEAGTSPATPGADAAGVAEGGAPTAPVSDGWLSADQRRRADALISLFENGTPVIQYDYVEALGDGRGYTAGRGFTTGTGDLLSVVKLFAARAPGNVLTKYLPRLTELAASSSDSITGLSDFPASWKDASMDAVFRKAQDDVVDRDVYFVAMKHCDEVGLKTALGRFVIYDTLFMHGDGADLDGTPALLKATNAAVGLPKTGTDEKVWLRQFLKVRRADLSYAHDPATRSVWAQAVGRCDALSAIESTGNYTLSGPIVLTGEYATKIL
ncbi:MAG: hypothetical protein NVS3B20_01590 [Polyangiales bacterium]